MDQTHYNSWWKLQNHKQLFWLIEGWGYYLEAGSSGKAPAVKLSGGASRSRSTPNANILTQQYLAVSKNFNLTLFKARAHIMKNFSDIRDNKKIKEYECK